ncbi:MAG: arabinose efflux permease [Clostridiaceae bacterium]|jgi:MFS family permease|nr:arabinose efflux permease [Clostridiaceae bacterium]
MNNYRKYLKRNINITYLFNFLMYFRVTNAIWMIYLSSKGLSLSQLGILEGIFHVTCFLCEVPTGAIADMFGRKFSVVLGRMSAVISTILMIFSTNILGFAIAFIFSGLSYTLNSGSGESLTYDSLKELNIQNQYKRVAGNINFIIEIAQGIAIIIGGILSDKRFLYAYLLCLAVETVSMLIALMFTEPSIIDKSQENIGMIKQVKNSAAIIKNDLNILYLILFFSLISTLGTTVYFYCQNYFDELHFSKTLISIIFTMDNVLNALSAKFAFKIEEKLNKKGIVILMTILNAAGLFGLAFMKGYFTIIFFLMTSFIEGLGYPIFSDYINSLIPSENRATILSFESAVFSIFMIGFFPLVGYIGQRVGLSFAFMIIAFIFIPNVFYLIRKLI